MTHLPSFFETSKSLNKEEVLRNLFTSQIADVSSTKGLHLHPHIVLVCELDLLTIKLTTYEYINNEFNWADCLFNRLCTLSVLAYASSLKKHDFIRLTSPFGQLLAQEAHFGYGKLLSEVVREQQETCKTYKNGKERRKAALGFDCSDITAKSKKMLMSLEQTLVQSQVIREGKKHSGVEGATVSQPGAEQNHSQGNSMKRMAQMKRSRRHTCFGPVPERFDIIGISETWWNETCDWSALLDSYRLFRRDRQGRRGEGVALYLIEELEHMDLTVGNGTVKSLCIRIKGKTNNVDIIMRVCYRPPSQDADANKLFFEELRDVSKSTALVLMGDFNLPEINWEHHTAGTTQARRFLKNLDDNFME
ncbi:hypothetical protein BTVI_63707 [Pitangus sulphuratus]|nr:hypothetical protein BTVI_63707 [Pitangus sulphuratus]